MEEAEDEGGADDHMFLLLWEKAEWEYEAEWEFRNVLILLFISIKFQQLKLSNILKTCQNVFKIYLISKPSSQEYEYTNKI